MIPGHANSFNCHVTFKMRSVLTDPTTVDPTLSGLGKRRRWCDHVGSRVVPRIPRPPRTVQCRKTRVDTSVVSLTTKHDTHPRASRQRGNRQRPAATARVCCSSTRERRGHGQAPRSRAARITRHVPPRWAVSYRLTVTRRRGRRRALRSGASARGSL